MAITNVLSTFATRAQRYAHLLRWIAVDSRWRTRWDLGPEQIVAFQATAGACLRQLGYTIETPV